MNNVGWVSIHRKISENELWFSEKFTKGQAWLDLIIFANHTPRSIWIHGVEVRVGRGQIAWSERTMSKRWKWSRNKVRRFLSWLESNQQITQKKTNTTSLITISNYDKYQDTTSTQISRVLMEKNEENDTTTTRQNLQETIPQTEQQTIPQKDHKRNTNNNVNNVNNKKKEKKRKKKLVANSNEPISTAGTPKRYLGTSKEIIEELKSEGRFALTDDGKIDRSTPVVRFEDGIVSVKGWLYVRDEFRPHVCRDLYTNESQQFSDTFNRMWLDEYLTTKEAVEAETKGGKVGS